MRLTVAAMAVCLIGGVSIAEDARASIRRPTNIPAENLGAALQTLAADRDVQLVYFTAKIDALQTQGALGELTTEEAFSQVLSGTGFTYRYLRDNIITIVPITQTDDASAVTGRGSLSSEGKSRSQDSANATVTEDRKAGRSFRDRFRVARVDQGKAASDSSVEQNRNESSSQNAMNPQGVEEVVVTAQKRSENLQRVPIAITAVTGQALQAKGIQNVFDLNSTVPSLNIQKNVSSPVIYTRGVGLISSTPGNENTTAIYVDGVYYMAPISSVFSLSNIERMEVLKGPQGTLFGRNATGGLISIITRDPRHETADNIDVSYGNYDTVSANGYMTTGLSENVAADLAFYTSTQGRGWGHNLVTGNEVYRRDETSLRSKVLFTPSENWKITLAGDYSFASDDVGVAKQPFRGTIVQGGSSAPASIWDVAEPIDPYSKSRNFGGSLRNEYSLAWADFLSLTAIRESTTHNFFDQVAATIPQQIFRMDPDQSIWWTQELQLQSPARSGLTWIVGLYYLGANSGYLPLRAGTQPTGPFIDIHARQDTQSYSFYAQVAREIFAGTNLTLGARGTVDRRHADGFFRLPTGSVVNQTDLHHTWRSPTWRIALDHRFTEDVTGYVSYSRGFKSGVYNTTALTPTQRPVDPEKLDAFEGGLKTELFERNLRLNWAGFYYNYKDQQLQLSRLGSILFLNAAESRMYGGELEADAKVTGRLRLQAGASFLHAKYSSFPSAPCSVPRPGGGNIVVACDASGKDMIRAPRVTLNALAEYTVPVGSASITASVNYYHNDGFFAEASNRLHQPHYDLVNGQIACRDAADQWEARLWVRNAFNRQYSTFISTGTIGDTDSPGAPRTYGVTVSHRF
jgi:iron complex outermembrane receptor protein